MFTFLHIYTHTYNFVYKIVHVHILYAVINLYFIVISLESQVDVNENFNRIRNIYM